jgi:predicted DNA binding CopG/RHH family protein
MRHDNKKRDPLPDESASLEEIADFWATHDTTEYAEAFVDVNVTFDIKQRHYQVEIQKDTFELLAKRAASLNMPVQKIIEEALRKELASAQ